MATKYAVHGVHSPVQRIFRFNILLILILQKFFLYNFSFYQVFLIYKSPVRSARIQPIGIAIQIPVSPRNVAEST